jgi:hypothetical protein
MMLIGLTIPETRRLTIALLANQAREPAKILAWSIWRRTRQWQAKRSHYNRRGYAWP